jgi:hypothetical protein
MTYLTKEDVDGIIDTIRIEHVGGLATNDLEELHALAPKGLVAPEGEATEWVTVPDDQFSFDWVKPGMRVKLESGRVLLVGNVNDLMGECDCCRVHGRIVAYQSTPQSGSPK